MSGASPWATSTCCQVRRSRRKRSCDLESSSLDFALVSVAGCRRTDGDVRIVFGGLAPRPWRVNSSVEEDVSSGGLDEDTIATLAERALYDAKPLAKNAYKVDLAASLLRQIIAEVA